MSRSTSKKVPQNSPSYPEYWYPKKWIVRRFDPEGGTPFESKVYRKEAAADYVGRETFLQAVVDVPLKHFHIDSSLIYLASDDLNLLEYFGLFLPVAKLIVPSGCAFSGFNVKQGCETKNHNRWARWSHGKQNWIFRVLDQSKHIYYKNSNVINGKILTPWDVDYWNSMRGIHPRKLKKYAEQYKPIYKIYKNNPFDLEFPSLRYMILCGNSTLDGQIVIPMYRVKDAYKCYMLLNFFYRMLPLDHAIITWFESRKRTKKHKRKINKANELKEMLWEIFINSYDILTKDREPQLVGLENITFDRYFYRNHFIATYVYSLIQQGAGVTKACEITADKLLRANPEGQEPLDPEYIRKKIYHPIIRKYRSIKDLIVT